ncbi:NAD(P)H-dependent oxidoreductase [Kaistella palustris]|uniref:NAD(P)H-dependent oxidoreductase n=1 Tax=Kaistella palustris TaxID=493376 RepID=UPI00041A9407|nr:NAD(P)H-dependent oxidoreductase [Kaistella palustris]
MKKTLVLFAHPYYEYSTANIELIKVYGDMAELDFKDLYEEFPDFHIPTFRERKRIRQYERLIFHFPLIWFSLPPLLKLWIDEVFDMTWNAEVNHPLQNKDAFIVVTVGGKEENYLEGGMYGTTVSDLLKSLTLSLKVNNIEVKNIIEVYKADDLDKTELLEFSEKIKKNLKDS